MKDQYQIIREELTRGLRLDERATRDNGALSSVVNLVPLNSGLHGYTRISTPFALSTSWPWPMLFRGRKVTLAASDTAVYEVDESDYSTSEYFIRDYADPDIEKVLSASTEPYHFVDMGESWLLIRGDITVFKMRLQELFMDGAGPLGIDYPVDYILACDDITIRTGAFNRGRVMFGGFDKDDLFSNAQWGELLNTYYSRFDTASSLQDIGQQFVLWGSIGFADIWGLFFPSLLIDGFIPSYTGGGVSKPPLFELIKSNQFGWMPLPIQGAVHVIKPLGENFVVYTEDGIFLLFPIKDVQLPSFGRQQISTIGVPGRGAVGGTDSEHLCIDNNGDLNIIIGQGELTRLRYRAQFSSILSQPMRITYDNDLALYHICCGTDGTLHFLFSLSGLSSCNAQTEVSACVSIDDDTIGFAESSSVGDAIALLTTDWLDFGTQELKQLTTIDVRNDHNSETLLSVDVVVYYADGTTYQRTALKLDPAGTLYVGMAGVKFRVTVNASHDSSVDPATVDTFDGLHIYSIRIGWKLLTGKTING